MDSASIIATIAKPTVDASSETLAIGPRKEPGFLVKIHPFDLNCALIRLSGDRFVLGRDPQCHLQIQDGSASRFHAAIERGNVGYEIADLQSTNGLYVNQHRVPRAILKTGDRIRVGDHIFKFLSAGHVEAEYHETVYAMMTRDGLTGALNKRFFGDALRREIERAGRTQRGLSLALLDIDYFKKINDAHGHLAGDEVLQEFTQRVARTLPSDALLARLGGEEFGFMLTDSELSSAMETATRVRQAIESRQFPTSAGPIAVTVSIGVSSVSSGGVLDEAFLAHADQLHYQSKHLGRNRVTGALFGSPSGASQATPTQEPVSDAVLA